MQALMIASGAMKAVGALQQARTEAGNYKSAAAANDYNALVTEGNARSAAEQASAREDMQRRNFRSLQGQAIAAAAQSGAGLDGSNADVLRQNAVNAELDALTIRYEGDQQTKGLMAQAGLQRFYATQNRKNAGRAMTAGYLNAGSALLQTAANYKMGA